MEWVCRVDQTTDTMGRWVLIDALIEDQLTLMSIGDVDYAEASVRKNLDAMGRELLLPGVKEVLAGGPSIQKETEHRGSRWSVRIEGIHSPINKVVVAIRAIYVPAGEPFPPAPVVGGIEWRIMDGGHIDTVWDDTMFSLYEVQRSGSGSGTGDMNGWVNYLIAPEDRARMKVVIDTGIGNPDGNRHTISYRIITRSKTDSPGSKQLEAVSRVVVDEEKGIKWLRSFTREVTYLNPSFPQEMDNQSAALVRAAFDLISNRAMFAVDTTTWQVFMTSKDWRQFGLQKPQSSYLPNSIHPDDFSSFAELCTMACPSSEPYPIRALQEDGTYRHYEVQASSGHFDTQGKRYVIVAVQPLIEN